MKGVPDSASRVSELETVEMSLGEALSIEQEVLERFSEVRITRSWSTELFSENVLETFGGLAGYVEHSRKGETDE